MLTDSLGFVLIFIVTLCLATPLGTYMKHVYNNDSSFLDFMLPLEKWLFKICGIDPQKSMDWKQYLLALLTIEVVWIVPAFIVLMLQGKPFLNPGVIPDMDWHLAHIFIGFF